MTTPHATDTGIWVDWIRKVCNPRVYLDVGAGDGFDCALVGAAFPYCRAVAIEPWEEWSVGTEYIQKYRDVIGRANKHECFYIKNQPGIHGLYSRTAVPTVSVEARPVRTLQHFCEKEGIPSIDAMKVDVEGAAWDVLSGASDLLKSVSAVHVETEWLELFDGQRQQSDVFGLLKRAGLEMVWEHRVEELGQGDSIWVRQ